VTVTVPGTIFEQFHSGWKFVGAFVDGAGLRFCIENPHKNLFLSFRVEKQNQQLLYDCLRFAHRDKKEPRFAETESMEIDDISQRGSS